MLDVRRCDSCWNLRTADTASLDTGGSDRRSICAEAHTSGPIHPSAEACDAGNRIASRHADFIAARDATGNTPGSHSVSCFTSAGCHSSAAPPDSANTDSRYRGAPGRAAARPDTRRASTRCCLGSGRDTSRSGGRIDWGSCAWRASPNQSIPGAGSKPASKETCTSARF